MNNVRNKWHIWIGCVLFVLLLSLSALGQTKTTQPEKKPLKLAEIRQRLTLQSTTRESIDGINKHLIADVRKRDVAFALLAAGEEALRAIGASEKLIKVIRNSPRTKDKMRLDAIFRDNASGNLKQRFVAVKAAKEFLQKYENDEDVKEFVEYLKRWMPQSEGIRSQY